MKKLPGLVVTIILAGTVLGQVAPPLRIITRPSPPTREVLDRLHLAQAWRVRIPLRGERDGLATVQVIPDKDGAQIAVQTLYGAVILMDAETGDTLWRTVVGQPYVKAQPVGFNSSSILVARANMLFILNRRTGSHRVFTLDKDSKLPVYGFPLPFAASAAPVADEDVVYVCLENQVTAFELPNYALIERLKVEKLSAEQIPSVLEQPERLWSHLFHDDHFFQPPLMSGSQVGVVSMDGTFLSLNRFKQEVRFDFQFNREIMAAAGQYGDVAYVGCDDYTLYALNMESGNLHWRFLGQAAIRRQPAVTKQDVFVTPFRRGMFRIDRASGEEKWRQPRAEQLLATNARFVYAVDRQGKFLILDYARGIEQAHYDTSDYGLPVTNEWTDRIYLASQDGQLLCLHDRDNSSPVFNKKLEEKKVPKEEKKAPPKEEKVQTGGRHSGDSAPIAGGRSRPVRNDQEARPGHRAGFLVARHEHHFWLFGGLTVHK